ncbi:DNA-J related domain-containing protein [Photobacterium lipolyticum]|uniref:Molecular chaperone DnaJ n=1 Tax=Photobacterium lipolyticum TaxID=266810 RepID=A0A2T3N1A9_9GAMM|nr:DNA-J related domain-containing protein [Photobacterium lipolyticum]PSW06086.1 molecular chaperone DnaJ [Photobacterium lipolyticum]
MHIDRHSQYDNPLIWPMISILKVKPTGWMIHTLSEELKHQGILKTLDDDPDKDLFKRNFLLMNALYQLQEMLLPDQWLQARAMDIQLSNNHPSENHHLDLNDPLREYYLDWRNYNADLATIEGLLSSFWKRYQQYIGSEKEYSYSGKRYFDTRAQSTIGAHHQDLAILELTKHAKPEEIRRQWRKMALRWHPDRPNGNAEKFRTVCEAWQRIQHYL